MTKITILLLLLSGSSLFAQKNRVYFGHKNLVEANYSFYMPLLSGTSYYVREGSSLVHKSYSSRPQHGLQLCFTRYLTGKLAFSAEFDYGRSKYAPSDFKASNTTFRAESIDVNCMSFIGKFEIGRRDGIFPIGISHQAGAGYMVLAPENKTLLATNQNNSETREINYNLDNGKGLTVFYNLNFRVTLSESLLLNFGLRYNYNYIFPTAVKNYQEPINNTEFASDVRTRLTANVIRFYTGIAFSF